MMETETAAPSRFYCHSCSTEIDHVLGGFKCPHCLNGFIEELPPEAAAPAPQEDGASGDFGNVENQAFRFANELFTNPLLTPILMSTTGARPGDAYGEGSSDDTSNSGRIGRRGGVRRDFNITNFDTILQDILISVGGGGGEGGPMFFMGNPGDYAWGREGLDTIVTQLLNQMDNTGPPPLDKEKIDELPQVKIQEDQVVAKLQCSVCWEDFQLDEPVKKLPCGHVYHDNCIVPWLQYHGTCPICRQSLVPEQQQQLSTDQQHQHQRSSLSAAAQAVANTIRNVTSAMRPGSSSGSNSHDDSNMITSSVAGSTMQPPNYTPSSFLSSTLPPFPHMHPYSRPTQTQPPTSNNTSTPSSYNSSLVAAPPTTSSGINYGGSSRPNDDRRRDDDGNIDYDDFD